MDTTLSQNTAFPPMYYYISAAANLDPTNGSTNTTGMADPAEEDILSSDLLVPSLPLVEIQGQEKISEAEGEKECESIQRNQSIRRSNESRTATELLGSTNPVHIAIRTNNFDEALMKLLEEYNINETFTSEKITFLHYAIFCHNNNAIKILLSKNANINHPNRYGETPLHLATRRGCDDIVALLLSNGANPDARTKRGYTPLHLAAFHNHVAVAKLLLSTSDPSIDINARAQGNTTPLHLATLMGHTEIVTILLEKGADVNATTVSHRSPLHIARNRSNSERDSLDNDMQNLLESWLEGENTLEKAKSPFTDTNNVESNSDSTSNFFPPKNSNAYKDPDRIKEPPQKRARLTPDAHTEGNNVSTHEFLRPQPLLPPPQIPLHIAAQIGDLEGLRRLLESGYKIDESSEVYGLTALHYAAFYNRLDIVKELLSRNANINSNTVRNETPLHFAAQRGHLQLAITLIANEANIKAVTEEGHTPLQLARKYGHKRLVNCLE